MCMVCRAAMTGALAILTVFNTGCFNGDGAPPPAGAGDPAGPVTQEAAGGTDADREAPAQPANGAGAAAPGARPDPAALQNRIEGVERALSDIDARISALTRTTDSRTPPPGETGRHAREALAALTANQQAIIERMAHFESRLKAAARPSPARRPARPRPAAPRLPFQLAGVEFWDGAPYAVLEQNGQAFVARQGEAVAGWRILRIDHSGRVTARHERTGRERTLTDGHGHE